jgi:hypothetical protein
LGLIWPLRGLIQKGQGTNMGAGFTLANLWPTLMTGWSPSAS